MAFRYLYTDCSMLLRAELQLILGAEASKSRLSFTSNFEKSQSSLNSAV